MSQTHFKQCLLRCGAIQQIAWIEEDMAVPGKHVRIGEQGWLVVCAWRRNTEEDDIGADGGQAEE